MPKNKTADAATSKPKAPALNDVAEAPKEKKPVEKKATVPAKLEESKQSEAPKGKQSQINFEAVMQEQGRETEKKKKE